MNSEYFKEYYKKNREKKLAYALEYTSNNKEKKKEYDKQRRLLQGNTLREHDRIRSKNPERLANKREWSRKRKMTVRQATPVWLTEEDKALIKSMYKQAVMQSKETGIPHEVDHVLPLHGKTVCGLHVPSNLQILTKDENFKKYNHFQLPWDKYPT